MTIIMRTIKFILLILNNVQIELANSVEPK